MESEKFYIDYNSQKEDEYGDQNRYFINLLPSFKKYVDITKSHLEFGINIKQKFTQINFTMDNYNLTWEYRPHQILDLIEDHEIQLYVHNRKTGKMDEVSNIIQILKQCRRDFEFEYVAYTCDLILLQHTLKDFDHTQITKQEFCLTFEDGKISNVTKENISILP